MARKNAVPFTPPAEIDPPAAAHTDPFPLVHTIQYGSVRGLIRRNTLDGPRPFTVTLDRFQQDKAGNGTSSMVFGSGDLHHLSKVAKDCQGWVDWQLRMMSQQVHGPT